MVKFEGQCWSIQWSIIPSHVVEFDVFKCHSLGTTSIFKESYMASLRLSLWHKEVRRDSKKSKIFRYCKITNSFLLTILLGNIVWMWFLVWKFLYHRTNTMKVFRNRTKAPNVGLIDDVEEGLRIVTLLGVVFVTSRCT